MIWLFPLCLAVLTVETLKKPALRSQPLNYFTATDGAAIICFTSGINLACFELCFVDLCMRSGKGVDPMDGWF